MWTQPCRDGAAMSDLCSGLRAIEVVLLVDDDERFLRTLKRDFERNGKQVLATPSGAEAIDLAREHEPQVAVIDLAMPPPDGIVVVRGIREFGFPT